MLGEWGYEEASEALRIGWGCPLEGPISNISSSFGADLLGYINYFLPITEMVVIMTGWLVAIAAYYIASIAMRWIKAIS